MLSMRVLAEYVRAIVGIADKSINVPNDMSFYSRKFGDGHRARSIHMDRKSKSQVAASKSAEDICILRNARLTQFRHRIHR